MNRDRFDRSSRFILRQFPKNWGRSSPAPSFVARRHTTLAYTPQFLIIRTCCHLAPLISHLFHEPPPVAPAQTREYTEPVRKVIGVLSIFVLVSLTFAQDNTIRVDTRLVQVTAIVHDKHGAAADLTKSDFEIRDKGKTRTIATFSVARMADQIPHSTLPPNTYTNKLDQKGDPPVAATVLLFDQLNTTITDQIYARKQATDFLKSIDPQSPVAIYVLGNGLRILHDFTDDRAQLARALERARNGNSTLLANSDLETLAAGVTATAAPGAIPSAQTSGTPQSGFTSDPDLIAAIFEPLQRYALDRRVAMTLAGMQVIASRMSGVPGRKNLLWISGGFPLSMAFDRGGIAGRTSQLVTYAGQMKDAASAIDRANVAIYPVDARGLMTNNPIRTAMPELRNQATQGTYNLPTGDQLTGNSEIETLKLLADWTGGKAFYNTNDLRGALKQAAEDSEVVYTLGFYVDQKDLDGSYHELKVKARKGDDVRYRRGYFATPLPATQTAGTILTDVALGPVDATGIGLTATLTPEPSAPGTYLMALGMDLNTLRLEEKNGKWSGGINVGIIQQGAEGKVLDSTANSIGLNITPENRQKLMKEGLTMRVAITPVPGLAQIRAAVMDQTSGNVGSLRIPAPK